MSKAPVDDKRPQPDPAEDNAFFPSPFSLSQFTSSKSNLSGADYPARASGNARKILMVCADERYLMMDNGTMFSTGNHPVETLLPMYHMDKAGFEFDIATISGNPVKFEFWAMPKEDEALKGLFAKHRAAFKQPLKLSDVIAKGLDAQDYIAVFIPGGHGALMGLPTSADMKVVLEWIAANDRFVISLCHGPAAFLAVGNSDIYKGYKICAFPDGMDAITPDIGYMPGHLTWKFGEKLKEIGFEILNDGVTGAVHRDRKMLTGDSPLAGNALGLLAARALLDEVSGS